MWNVCYHVVVENRLQPQFTKEVDLKKHRKMLLVPEPFAVLTHLREKQFLVCCFEVIFSTCFSKDNALMS